jgi:hypothetical protein
LDEIYEKDRKKTDSRTIWERARKKEEELNPNGKWRRFFDSAAAWFENEVSASFGSSGLIPVKKKKGDDDSQISLIKGMMATQDTLFISDKCFYLAWELDQFVTDENGEYPTTNEHLIDNFRYLVEACHFTFAERPDPTETITVKAEQQYSEGKKVLRTVNTKIEDWTDNIFEDHMIGDYDE